MRQYSVVIEIPRALEPKVYRLVRPKARRWHFRKYPREIPGGVTFTEVLTAKLAQRRESRRRALNHVADHVIDPARFDAEFGRMIQDVMDRYAGPRGFDIDARA